eukprot:4806925-Pleurochrysis_carterae.AAC.2
MPFVVHVFKIKRTVFLIDKQSQRPLLSFSARPRQRPHVVMWCCGVCSSLDSPKARLLLVMLMVRRASDINCEWTVSVHGAVDDDDVSL